MPTTKRADKQQPSVSIPDAAGAGRVKQTTYAKEKAATEAAAF